MAHRDLVGRRNAAGRLGPDGFTRLVVAAATWFADPLPPETSLATASERGRDRLVPAASSHPADPTSLQLDPHATRSPQLADPGHHALTLVASVVKSAPTR